MTKPLENGTNENERVRLVGEKTLANDWTRLSMIKLDYVDRHGILRRLKREIYHRTPAACILLYDPARDIVVLVKQFRLAAHLTGADGWMLEVPAGLLDDDNAENAIKREAMEETGYKVRNVRFLFKALMSPGAVTETTHFFAATVKASDRIGEGGGLAKEQEDIEVVELAFDAALAMIGSGEIYDMKTITLLHWAALNKEKLKAS